MSTLKIQDLKEGDWFRLKNGSKPFRFISELTPQEVYGASGGNHFIYDT